MQRSSWERHDLIAAPAVLRAISYHKKTTEHNGSFLSSKSPDHDYQTRPGLKEDRTRPESDKTMSHRDLPKVTIGAVGHAGVETTINNNAPFVS